MTAAPLPISASVHVDAPVEDVWDLLGDPTRMSEWSPECRRVVVLGSGPVREGSRLLGVNRRGLFVWPTLSQVVRLEPRRAVAWRTRESGATWTYELHEGDLGTVLTGRRDLFGFTWASRLAGPLLGGAEGHDHELAAGLATTLERIKADVEATAAATP